MIKNQWYAILPSNQVTKGNITSVKRMGLSLALFRNSKGELGCVTDRCSHRGAALSKGKVVGDCLQCPFHGLLFDTDGFCRKVPANGKASLDDLSRFNVTTYLVKEQYHMIYFWYGDKQKATKEIPFFEEEPLWHGVYSEMEDHWNTHYSRAIENQLDVVHLPFVHYNTIGRGNKTLVNGPKVIIHDTSLITSANNEVDMGQTPKSSEESSIRKTYLHFLFPNVWMNHISKEIRVVIFFAPVDNKNTTLYIRFYTSLSKIPWINRMIAFGGKYANRMIERQDKRVVITQQPKISAYHSKENLIKGDLPIIIYRKKRDELQHIE